MVVTEMLALLESHDELPIDGPWRDAVREAMPREGYNQKTLAAALGLQSNSIVSYILRDDGDPEQVNRSIHVRRISELLKIHLPWVAQIEIATRTMLELKDTEGLQSAALTLGALAQMAISRATR